MCSMTVEIAYPLPHKKKGFYILIRANNHKLSLSKEWTIGPLPDVDYLEKAIKDIVSVDQLDADAVDGMMRKVCEWSKGFLIDYYTVQFHDGEGHGNVCIIS